MADDESEETSRKEGVYWAVFAQVARQPEHKLTDEERAALAERYGLSEALLLRCERAFDAYRAAVGERLQYQARLEAIRHLKALGRKKVLDRENPEEFFNEVFKARMRLDAAEPETEITRECRAADDALRAALGLPPLNRPPNPSTPPEEP